MFYNRLKAGLEHGSGTSKISSNTLLIRAAKNTRAQSVGLDYGLGEVKLIIFFI